MSSLRLSLWLVLASIFAFSGAQSEAGNFEVVSKTILEYLQNGVESDEIAKILSSFPLTHVFREGKEDLYNTDGQLCHLCNTVVDFLLIERKIGLQRDTLAHELEYLCIHLGIENERVCKGAIELNLDIFLYVIDNYSNFTSNRACGSILQSYGCPTGDAFEWTITIPSGNSQDRPKPNDTDQEQFKILQLSDIHYDPLYKPYGNADCGEPNCCQDDQGEGATPETTCGYWTDYHDADSPLHLIEETIRQTKTQNFSYVYYTGDVINHRVWETSIENNTNTITKLYNLFKDNYNVPVFPIFGNHEPHPLNLWPSESVKDEKFSNQWLYELVVQHWSKLIGEDVSETVLKGGYYTVSPQPGFRIIAINSNLAYTFNWWLLFDDVDPFGQLQWLADTLKKAEENNESVHILSHIPTGSSEMLRVWGREYHRIVQRFANTITGQFNGHTHKDEFHVFYNESDETNAIGVAFNGASVTPFSNSNPSYKLYDVDSATFSLMDYQEWTFNLTLANLQPTELPQWYKMYSFTETFGINNLSPLEVDKVLYKMAEDHSLLDKYFKFKYRNGDIQISKGCDENCQKSNLCQIATTIFGEDTQCQKFLSLYDSSLSRN